MEIVDLASVTDVLQNNPVVIYAAAASIVLGYVATVSAELQKILGPLGRWLGARQARRVRRAATQTDVRILDMQGQVDHLAPRLDAVETELYELRALAAEHARWDWQVLDAVRQTIPDFPAPPPLRPATQRPGGTS